jgi:hypothetical protein
MIVVPESGHAVHVENPLPLVRAIRKFLLKLHKTWAWRRHTTKWQIYPGVVLRVWDTSDPPALPYWVDGRKVSFVSRACTSSAGDALLHFQAIYLRMSHEPTGITGVINLWLKWVNYLWMEQVTFCDSWISTTELMLSLGVRNSVLMLNLLPPMVKIASG